MSSGLLPRIGLLAAGAVLLAVALAVVDPGEVLDLLSRVGWGFVLILGLHAAGFGADTVAWHLALPAFPFDLRHHWRLFRIRMIGELFNNITPLLGGVAGEPVKAMILKRRHDVSVRAAAASLIVVKTVILLSLVAFMALGFVLMLGLPAFPAAHVAIVGAGLTGFTAAILAFYLVQRFSVASRLGRRLDDTRLGRRVAGVLHDIQDVDDRLVAFYAGRRRRFVLAFAAAFLGWSLGVVEVMVAANLMGGDVDLGEALVIEAVIQLVRGGLFFIPAGIGVQEGTLLLLFEAMTGDAALGVAVALARRGRDIVWLAACAALAWAEGWREVTRAAD